ncbi:hypothetical protein WJX84_003832 [Apatococcus fuscideae]|uniref:Uncharacterized protein n=1 Tax=Apatococcus fuscideae TaxID=2026836 RepID=A0AAW1SVL9_9CHLO
MPPDSPFRRGTSLNPFRSKESFVQSPSLTRRQAFEAEQATQASATSKSWFRGSRQSQGGMLQKKGSGMPNRQNDVQLTLEEEIEYWKNQNQQQEVELQELEHSLGEKSKESSDLQARWNLENFKYNLLVDMWAMRVLDNEQLSTRT